ncbi:MAG: helix-turn-helix domain-containing protein [Clostridiales bacterium]|jgi:transcriptional regulator with XRE-family HTH domain|nr:helix-turn-helix domain-containing protein [Clostridiales bacterium]
MLGKKIKELRTEKGITQKELAKKLNLSPQAISLWEKDKADPDLLNIKAIAKFFEISTDELLEFETYIYSFEYKHENTKLIHKEKK